MKLRHVLVALLLLVAASPSPAQKLVGEGKIFVRLTNLRPDDAAILVRVNITPNHNKPFGWRGWVTLVGQIEDPHEVKHADKWLRPGASSPWVDLGKSMTLRGTRSPDTYLSPVLFGVRTFENRSGLHLLAEVAEGRGDKVVRRIEVHKPELSPGKADYPWVLGYGTWNVAGPKLPTLALLIPTRMDIAARIYTFEEALQWQLDFIEEFPDRGRLPTKFVFETRALGPIYKALGYRPHSPGTVEASFGDEISIHLKMPAEQQNRLFRQQMTAKGLDPIDLIAADAVEQAKALDEAAQWELVTVDPPLPDRPKHFFEAADFRYRLWYEELAARTAETIKRHPLQRVLTGANFSPHMNVWPDVRQWVGPFRAGAMTMSWTEDWWWQIPEVTPQVYGFLLDAFRLAHSYHGAPIQFYVMPFRGNSPDNIRRMNHMAVAHGTKVLNHFVTEGQMLVTWDYVSVVDSPRTYQAIHDVIRDIGSVERRLYPAMPRPAEVAIMLSRASDTWDTENLGGAGHLYYAEHNVNNEERKAIWTILRHAQYPVDLILDEDIIAGRLNAYKVLYIVGSEMLREASEPLKQWVAGGGVVYATGGGGLLDEYREPITPLYELYGLEGHELIRHSRHIRPRQTLRDIEAHDTLVVNGAAESIESLSLPAYMYRERLVPGDGSVLGEYASNGDVGMVVHDYGEGRAYYCGVLAGIAYWQPAIGKMLPEDFPGEIRSFLSTPLRRAEVRRHMHTSQPLVEAQYMTGPHGDIVSLINWSNAPIEELVVTFPGRENIRRVRSLRAAGHFKGDLHDHDRGLLEVTVEETSAQVKLRLAVNDYLLVN